MLRLLFGVGFIVSIVATRVAASSTMWGQDDPRLCSAYLFRTSARVTTDRLRKNSRETLQAHFDAVIGSLLRNTETSLDVALDRLEDSLSANWSDRERCDWRQLLLQRRLTNLNRLVVYRQRGRFPKNTISTQTVPVFVDQSKTACAVGYLMIQSGWQADVRAISESSNGVYVSDVKSGPLVEWIRRSGLTQEEAALIQPGYPFPPELQTNVAEVQENGAFEIGFLRFSNFELRAEGDGRAPDAEKIGISGFFGPKYLTPPGAWAGAYEPELDFWLYLGDFFEYGALGLTRGTEDLQVVLSYDLETTSDFKLTDFLLHVDNQFDENPFGRGIFGSNRANPVDSRNNDYGELSIQSQISAQGEEVHTVGITVTEPPYGLRGNPSTQFLPQRSVRVETLIDFHDAGVVTNLVHQFSFDMPLNTDSGDFNFDRRLDITDLNELVSLVQSGTYFEYHDLNNDDLIDMADIRRWVKGLRKTYIGDANLDGEFNSADLVTVFQAGDYGNSIGKHSGWAQGDWNADGVFGSGDLVLAFQDGGYEQGPRQDVTAIPEPSSARLAVVVAALMIRRTRTVVLASWDS